MTSVPNQSTTELAPFACQCCGNILQPAGNNNGYSLWTCPACDFLTTSPPPTAAELAAIYNDAYFCSAERTRDGRKLGYTNLLSRGAIRGTIQMSQTRLAIIARLAKGPSDILDVGCAAGTFLTTAAKQKWRIAGVELNQSMRDRAYNSCGGGVFKKDLKDISGPFSVITMWEYLEHVIDPSNTLKCARERLRHHGILALSFPNLESQQSLSDQMAWEQVKPPEHLHHFNANNIRQLLSQHGFDVVGFRYHGHRLVLSSGRKFGSRSNKKTPLWPIGSMVSILLRPYGQTKFKKTFSPRVRQCYEGLEVYAKAV